MLFTLALFACNDAPKKSEETPKISPTHPLKKPLEDILLKYKAKIGLAFKHIEYGDTLTINNNHHYPTQSVYKFPLAMAILNQVDQGKIHLGDQINVTKKDLKEDTWSPIADKYPKGAKLSIADLLEYTVSQSDNNGCDILFRLLNGPSQVNNYIHQLGIKEMAIAATEDEMHHGWEPQYTNWSHPFSYITLLEKLYQHKSLSDSSSAFLMKLMIESSNSAKRIKGLLPENIILAHKTGTSGDNDSGMTAAVNDVGIITLPDGNHIALAIFVSDTYEDLETNEHIIAEISKVIFDYYTTKKKN
jgi:beta-lactamase class A